MSKKLTKHGNSLALVLDRPILDMLKIDENTDLEISTDGARLIIYPSHGEKKRGQLERWMKKNFKKRDEVYKALSSPGK